MIKMTMLDPKNSVKGYRFVELYDEIEEIKRYISGEVSGDYILIILIIFSSNPQPHSHLCSFHEFQLNV